MNVVLLSGGSGKRLWPLSNDMQSKQFLKLLKNNRGEYESMVQRVARQLITSHANASLFVSCNFAQEEIINKQLNAVELILEPARRDTFPAVALAAAYLFYQKQMSQDDVFIVCPIDPYADNTYFELLENVEHLVVSGEFNIGLMGALPTYPSEKYGYIEHSDMVVSGFIEKPPLEEAARLLDEGALWNCGVFALKIGYVLSHARKYVNFDSFESLQEQYTKLPKISFDYEVVEKEGSIGVVIYDGVWKDLGTWNTLAEEISGSSIGKHIITSDSSTNTHVLNMLDLPIIVQDISDAVVVASHDGILVSSKHGSSFLKPLAEQMDFSPMYEQRSWGDYRVLENNQSGKSFSVVKRLRIEQGKSITPDYADKQSVAWVVTSGKGILTINGVDSVLSSGSTLEIDTNAEVIFLAATEMQLIEIINEQEIRG